MTAVVIVALTAPAGARADIFDPIQNIYDLIAQGFEDAWPGERPPEGFQVDVGVGLANLPKYQGADRYRFAAIPLVRVTYGDSVALRNTKLTVNLLRFGDLKAGALAKYYFGRNESEDPLLQGLGNIGDTVEIGGFVRYDFKHLIVTAELREGISEGQGMTAYFTLAHGLYRTEKLRVGVLASAIWGSRESLQTNFGITEAQAAASAAGLRPFTTGSGLYQVTAFVGGEYALTEHWRLGALMGYARLLNDAADSPIVTDIGSPNMATAGVGVLYRF